MTSPSVHADAYRTLHYISNGEAPLDRLVAVLSEFPEMFALSPDEQLLAYLQGWAARQGHEQQEAFQPLVDGSIERGSFVPYCFTRQEFARQIAINRGQIQPYQALLLETQEWAVALYTFLAEGYGGIYIDPGTEHGIKLNRKSLCRIVSLLTMPTFASFPYLHVICKDERIAVHSVNGVPSLLAFDCNASTLQSILIEENSALPKGDFSIRSLPTEEVLRFGMQSAVHQICINPGLNDSRQYYRSDIGRLLDLIAAGGENGLRKIPQW